MAIEQGYCKCHSMTVGGDHVCMHIYIIIIYITSGAHNSGYGLLIIYRIYRWISWCLLPWELEGITSPCCLLIGQYPHHMTLCPPVAIQRFSKFLQHPVTRARTVPSNQIAEFKFCSLIGSHSWRCCNRKLQELGKAL